MSSFWCRKNRWHDVAKVTSQNSTQISMQRWQLFAVFFFCCLLDYFSQKSTTYPQKMPKNLSKRLQNLHQKPQIFIKKGRDFSRPFAFLYCLFQ
ncbi:MAG: hypothetical protein IKA29_03440, partial [Clostridia bacterium]|nr:hypothetical protein [Clostridia bacterium]